MNEISIFPCKFCGHPENEHFVFEDTAGQWMYHEDVGHEVWVESPYERLVCNTCQIDCEFQEMDNLEYLEWKCEQKMVDNNEIRS